jgi:flagellar basal-body rod modification protein FlgD
MTVSLDGVSFVSDKEGPEFISPGDNVNLGKDSFLKLLVTQMQNQDPLNPQSNEEFIAQLSQFTQVEQLMNMNDGFESLYMAMNSINNTSMTQLLGKEVLAYGDKLSYDGEGSVELNYDAAGDSQNSRLTVYNEEGSVVYTGSIDPVKEGEGSFTWDPVDMDGQPLPEGTYTYSIEANGSDGETIEVAELMSGVIDGMTFINGVPTPSINDIEFDLSSIVRVEQAD